MKNISVIWPLSVNVVCNFIEWAHYEKKLSSSTIRSYVSNLSTIHKLMFNNSEVFSDFRVKIALKGIENLALIPGKNLKPRKAMTLPVLRIIGHRIALENWAQQSKLVVWTAMCVCFFGSFRMGELLSKSEFGFNSSETLMWADVRFLNDGSVQILNKLSKSRTPGGEVIDLFPFKRGCCPVAGLSALKGALSPDPNLPVFRFASGKLLTQKMINEIIHNCLVPVFGPGGREYSGHSFRAGLPSALAACRELSSEKDIKKWGRWKSNAFERYTRLNHKAKRGIFEQFKKALE
jgi:hypothetical protein